MLNFEPPIWSPSNYTITVLSDTELSLSLAEGSKWSKYGGALLVKGINVGDGEVRIWASSALQMCLLFFLAWLVSPHRQDGDADVSNRLAFM